jgi:hypothetical protein
MIIGMPVITAKCRSGHYMTQDNIVSSRSGSYWCVPCLYEGGLEAVCGRDRLQRHGIDYAEVDGDLWVSAEQLREAHEEGASVKTLSAALGRDMKTIRRRIIMAGGDIRPARYAQRRRVVTAPEAKFPRRVETVEETKDPRLAQMLLHEANQALVGVWNENNAVVRINEDASRLAEELMADVDWYNPWQDCEPASDLWLLRVDREVNPYPRRPRDDEPAVMVAFTEAQRAQLELLTQDKIPKVEVIRRLIATHVQGSPLPAEPYRSDHSYRLQVGLYASERAYLEALARFEGKTMSALVRALVARAADEASVPPPPTV